MTEPENVKPPEVLRLLVCPNGCAAILHRSNCASADRFEVEYQPVPTPEQERLCDDEEVRERTARALARAAPPALDLPWDQLPHDEKLPYYEGADAVLMELGDTLYRHPAPDREAALREAAEHGYRRAASKLPDAESAVRGLRSAAADLLKAAKSLGPGWHETEGKNPEYERLRVALGAFDNPPLKPCCLCDRDATIYPPYCTNSPDGRHYTANEARDTIGSLVFNAEVQQIARDLADAYADGDDTDDLFNDLLAALDTGGSADG